MRLLFPLESRPVGEGNSPAGYFLAKLFALENLRSAGLCQSGNLFKNKGLGYSHERAATCLHDSAPKRRLVAMTKRGNAGFSILELVIVVAICSSWRRLLSQTLTPCCEVTG